MLKIYYIYKNRREISLRYLKTYFFTKYNLVATILMYFYFFITTYLFRDWVMPVYSTANFNLLFNINNLYASIIYISFIAFFTLRPQNDAVRFILSIFAFMTVIPMLVLYCMTKENAHYHLFVFVYVCCFGVVSFFSCFSFNAKRYLTNANICRRLLLPMFLLTILVIARFVALNGLGIFNLDIMKVYNYRLALRETMGGILAYLDSWVMKIINPFCIVYSLSKRKNLAAFIFFILQVILFGFSSQKSVLFQGIFIVLVYFSFPLFIKKTTIIKYFVLGLILLLFISITKQENYLVVITRALYNRVFFTPSQINFWYYDFFSSNGFDWFRQSFLRHFMVSKYDALLPRLIGLEYYNNIETNANTGFLASGYAQGGFLVMFIYSIIVGIIIAYIVSLSKRMPERVVISISIIPLIFLFTSGDLPSSIVTGGIGIMILLFLVTMKFSR